MHSGSRPVNRGSNGSKPSIVSPEPYPVNPRRSPPDQGGVEVAARHRVPGRVERRVEGQPYPVEPDAVIFIREMEPGCLVLVEHGGASYPAIVAAQAAGARAPWSPARPAVPGRPAACRRPGRTGPARGSSGRRGRCPGRADPARRNSELRRSMAWAATTNSIAATRAHRADHVGQPPRGQRRHRGPVLDALALHRTGQLVGDRMGQRARLDGDGLPGGGQFGQGIIRGSPRGRPGRPAVPSRAPAAT